MNIKLCLQINNNEMPNENISPTHKAFEEIPLCMRRYI